MLGLLLLSLPTSAAAAPERPRSEVTRYSLAGGCYALRSQKLGRLVAKSPDAGYRASATQVGTAEPFRMQATDLGRYLLYGVERDFLAGSAGGGAERPTEPADAPSESADWTVRAAGGGFTILSQQAGKALATSSDGDLVLADLATAGNAARFTFERASGCARYPEVQVNARGRPQARKPRYGEARGLLDMHAHLMGHEAYGGDYHCGRPWHPYGAPYALPDCADIYGPRASAAPVQNFVDSGSPVAPHDTRGWPTFHDWPEWNRSNYEQLYYKWLERAWRAGLRIFVPLHNDNQVLCELMARRHTNCNEMDTVRRQIRDTYKLQDYIDAQSGGPGKGWFRVVRNPFQARRVINRGKLAVVQGIETSVPLDCNIYNGVPECGPDDVDSGLNEVYRLGVRQMELLNIYDNAFAGVWATDRIRNLGNFLQTGRWWEIETCTTHEHEGTQDLHGHLVGAALQALLPPGTAPVYPPPPHCNARGLSGLGEHIIRGLIRRGMMIDPDHLGVRAGSQAVALLGANDYPGVISSHSWSAESTYPRVYRLGGLTTPYAGGSTGFVDSWHERRKLRRDRFMFGFGYGSDVHGLTWLGGPRTPSAEAPPVDYPFKSFDGAVTLNRQRSGERVFDINHDGVAHYGLYADWIEDLRILAGRRIIRDMARGAEAYLQTWERAVGVPAPRCLAPRGRFTGRGLGKVRLGRGPARLLRRAGQPEQRSRAWRYCVRGAKSRDAKVVAVFTPDARVGVVGSRARGHTAGGIGPGDPARRVDGEALGGGLWTRATGRRGARFVYGVRDRRVRLVGVASRAVAGNERRLRQHLGLARLR